MRNRKVKNLPSLNFILLKSFHHLFSLYEDAIKVLNNLMQMLPDPFRSDFDFI